MADLDENSGARTGYGHPPMHTRFKSGKSGNPSGRPPGRKNLATLLQDALDEELTIMIGRRSRVVTFREAAALRLAMKAATGDPRAIAIILRIDEAPENKSAKQLVFVVGKEDAGH